MRQTSVDYYQLNLKALRSRQALVADIIDNAVVPEGVVEAVGRDGSRTFRVPADLRGQPAPTSSKSPVPASTTGDVPRDIRQGTKSVQVAEAGKRWFGGSSMPRISAEEMFCNVGAGGGSVTLPGILTGAEAVEISRRLGPRHAVFVMEESPINLKLAMRLHDYAGLIEQGRLVFVPADDTVSRMRLLFAEHPGYELPGQLFKVPQRTAGQIAEIQRSIEIAGGEVLRVQAQSVSRSVEALRAKKQKPISESPCVAIVGIDDAGPAAEQANRLSQAMNRLGWRHSVCVPERPDLRHVAARLQSIVDISADMVIYIGGAPAAERALLPVEMPVVHVFVGDGVPRSAVVEGRGPFDLFLAVSQPMLVKLLESGVPKGRAGRMEPACHAATLCASPVGNETERRTAAVMMDLPDDRPEASGVTLPSQIALWEAMQRIVLRDADRYDDSTAGEVLARAQEECGTALSDEGVSGMFLSLLRSRIGPASVARAMASALVRRGSAVSLWGEHWPAMGRGGDGRRGPIPRSDEMETAVGNALLVVLPWYSRASVQLAVDAMGRGAVVAMRGSHEVFARGYPDLAVAGQSVNFFQRGDELTKLADAVRSDESRFAEEAMDGMREVMAKHTMECRLGQIVERIRELQRETGFLRARSPGEKAGVERASCGPS